MALISCTECYESISDTAMTCPKCGAVTELSKLVTQLKDGRKARLVLWLLVLWPLCGLLIASVIYYFDYGTNPIACAIQVVTEKVTPVCRIMGYSLQVTQEKMMKYLSKSDWLVWAWLACVGLLIFTSWGVSKFEKMIGDRHKV